MVSYFLNLTGCDCGERSAYYEMECDVNLVWLGAERAEGGMKSGRKRWMRLAGRVSGKVLQWLGFDWRLWGQWVSDLIGHKLIQKHKSECTRTCIHTQTQLCLCHMLLSPSFCFHAFHHFSLSICFPSLSISSFSRHFTLPFFFRLVILFFSFYTFPPPRRWCFSCKPLGVRCYVHF